MVEPSAFPRIDFDAWHPHYFAFLVLPDFGGQRVVGAQLHKNGNAHFGRFSSPGARPSGSLRIAAKK